MQSIAKLLRSIPQKSQIDKKESRNLQKNSMTACQINMKSTIKVLQFVN